MISPQDIDIARGIGVGAILAVVACAIISQVLREKKTASKIPQHVKVEGVPPMKYEEGNVQMVYLHPNGFLAIRGAVFHLDGKPVLATDTAVGIFYVVTKGPDLW